MSKNYCFFLAILLLIAVSFAGCVDESAVDTPVSPTAYPGAKTTTVKTTIVKTAVTTVAPQEDFTVSDVHQTYGQYGNQIIEGTVKNNNDKTYRYVQVTLNLYDDSGAQVGSTLANVNNLEPFGTWKFKAPVLLGETEWATAKVKTVTGY